MKKILKLTWIAIFALLNFYAEAYIPMGVHGKPVFETKKSKNTNSVLQDCAVSKSQADLNVNNVRSRLQGGGDLWWDFKNGLYVVPNVPAGVSPVSSIFAGGIWIGGTDLGGNLKIAAAMYRSATSNDWFPGPLDIDGTTNPSVCSNWDKHFSVYKKEIEAFKLAYKNAPKDANGKVTDASFKKKIPKSIIGWAGKGNPYFLETHGFSMPINQRMAYFYDQNGDNEYDPFHGDYPAINVGNIITNSSSDGVCKDPDQIIWWVFNDAGGVHTQSKSPEALRMEMQATAFAFATDDDVNNMTFQNYKMNYKGSQALDSCFISLWVDPDLGCYQDDFLGCEITPDYMGKKRTMMYVYNEDEIDGSPGTTCPGGIATYGKDAPILGIDIVELPKEKGVEVNTSFMYFGNGSVGMPNIPQQDPSQVLEHYRYMNAIWRDGTPLSVGGNGYTQNPKNADITKFAFADAPNDPTGWSMRTAKLPYGDRRGLLNAGAFNLKPGQIQSITYSLPWVSHQGGGAVDLTSLRRASTQAREMFNRCFYLFGPSAPNVNTLGLDKMAVLNLENTSKDNFRFESNYKEQSFLLPKEAYIKPSNPDIGFYKFEGYKIYQLANENDGVTDVNARLVAITDLANGVKKIYNWTPKKDPNDSTFPNFTSELQADCDDKGIKRSFSFTQDAFATGSDKGLVNGKKYYYTVVPFGYNNFGNFNKLSGNGQKLQYVKGRENVRTYTIVPDGAIPSSKYGIEFPITRYDGVGAGGNYLDMQDDVYTKIFDKTFDGTIAYKAGNAPIKVMVVNPAKLQIGEYSIRFVDGNMLDDMLGADAKWQLQKKGGQVITSANTIAQLNEQIIDEYGLLVSIGQQKEPCSLRKGVQGMMAQDISFKNNTPWFRTITDDDENIKGGAQFCNYISYDGGEELVNFDCLQGVPFEKSDLIFPPYAACDYKTRTIGTAGLISPYTTPAWFNNSNNTNYLLSSKSALSKLPNVDIILTSDKSKWSRCVVVETMNTMHKSDGLESEKSGNLKGNCFDMRAGKSIGSDTNPDAPSDGTLGKSWFPGYAIDVETGQRLNIVFGENSGYDADNQALKENFNLKSSQLTGRDMIWNPTNDVLIDLDPIFQDTVKTAVNLIAGCGHYIYVTTSAYDGCAELYTSGATGAAKFSRDFSKTIAYTAMPYLEKGATLLSYKDGLIPSECTVKLRVNNPYEVLKGVGTNNNHPSYGFNILQKIVKIITLASENIEKFNLYPNPIAANGAALTLTNLPAVCTIHIYSMDGKMLYQTQRKQEGNDDKTELISSPNLQTAGIYLVVVKTENGVQSRKLVAY